MASDGVWPLEQLEALYISPTNYCNLRCPMCPNKQIAIPRGFLDPDLFGRLLEELAQLRGVPGAAFKELHFANDGEPFLHPKYLEMLEYLDQTVQGLHVFISSNACLLDEAKIERLLALRHNNYYLILSLDASYRTLYCEVRPGGNFERAQRNVRYVLERKQAADIRNPYAVVQFVVMPTNEHDRHDFYWQWEPYLGPAHKTSVYTWWEGLNEINRAHVAWKEYTSGWSGLPIVPLTRGPDGQVISANGAELTCLHPQRPVTPARICAWPWRRISVGWDGGVGLCCWHWESLGLWGSLRNHSLREIFEGGAAATFRDRFWHGRCEQLPICGHCDCRDWWYDPALETEIALREADPPV